MKAVMKSVSPRICEKVANGDCAILVSKTAPKCEVPFKCYIYCTKNRDNEIYKRYKVDDIKSGKVIGEFVCDNVEWMSMRDCDNACMTLKEAVDYAKGKPLYGWHISDLKIYGKPKELSEFRKPCKINLPMCDRCEYYSTWNGRCENITRAPQGWCYIES